MHETQGTHTIRINELTRVEGQGALYVKVEEGRVVRTLFKIFEPPRFFEAFLQGRDCAEVPDITARICGICPVAYQMSSCHALESIFDALPPTGSAIRALRRLFYCGEWIESHALHVFFLHLPDFMGRPDSIEIARTHPELIERGIRIRKAGNTLISVLGGRAMHPVGAKVGGWHRAPRRQELDALLPLLRAGLDNAIQSAKWMKEHLEVPQFEQDYEFIALRHPEEYPMNEGRIASTAGWDCGNGDWDSSFEERQVEHSNAYQSVVKGTGNVYFAGPLARFNLNHERLSPSARNLADALALRPPIRNPYAGMFVRLVEIAHCFEEAASIIEKYERPQSPAVPLRIREGKGSWTTEAPRGILHHRYRVNADGTVALARIIPPTSQNQGRIERDLTALVQSRLDLGDHDLSHACEFMIRNYDPCISCATHFLSFRIDR